MLLCLYNRSGQAKSLKTDEADEVFNVTENKINSYHRHFLPETLLRFVATAIVVQGDFFWKFLKIFCKTLWTVGLEERSVHSDSECLGNNNFV